MICVKATREGCLGKPTASGYIVDNVVPFVALPATKALGHFIRVRNPKTLMTAVAWVADVGPWNTSDDHYVFGNARPAAESGHSVSGLGTNGAGIDLGEKIWHQLQMTDNGEVEWEFLII